jgi:GNAT superfamily N-acetyltransferase
MAADEALRAAAYGIEARTAAAVCDSERVEDWGRVYLTPSLPLVWDASLIELRETGLAIGEVVALAEEALGGGGLAHRTVVVADEAEGRRLATELAAAPGWEAERTLYMAWRGDGGGRRPQATAREAPLAEIAPLRGELIASWLRQGDPHQETVAQLLERDRRLGELAGDRWFVAPGAGDPAAACRLLRIDGVAQVEDVGTLPRARRRGLAQAVVLAAVAAAQRDGVDPIVIAADAGDWPHQLYAKLGFEPVGEATVLRRLPDPKTA